MKYYVSGIQEIQPCMVVEADTPKEAIEKAWNGDYDANDPRNADNAEYVKNVKMHKWYAEPV